MFEQRYVEGYLAKQGLLLPHYHRHYWMGLSSSAADYPVFSWLDANAPALTGGSAYLHWGYYVAPGGPSTGLRARQLAPACTGRVPQHQRPVQCV